MSRSFLTRALACALSVSLAVPAWCATAAPAASDQADEAAQDPCAVFDNAHCVDQPSGTVVPGSTQAKQQLRMAHKAPTRLDDAGSPPAATSGAAKAKDKPSFLSKLVKPAIGAAMVGGFALAGFLAGGPAAGLACLGIGVAVLAGMALMQGCGGGAKK